MMKSLPVLSVVVLLAGCSSPADVPSLDASAQGPGSEGTKGPVVHEFNGQFTGAGGAGVFAGMFSLPKLVPVGAGNASLAVNMTWESVLPHAVYLEVRDPDGESHVAEATAPYAGDEVLALQFEAPKPGKWYVVAFADGPAVDVQYVIRATVG